MTIITFVRDAAIEHAAQINALPAPDEEAWLPVLGPTAWLLGRLVHERLREAYRLEWEDEGLARRLGVGTGGHRRKPLANGIERLVHFGVLTTTDGDTYMMKAEWGHPPARRAVAALHE